MKGLALALVVVTASPLLGAEAAKPKKPALEVRFTPRFGFSPLNVLFIAELKGGADVEEFYCPEIEWDWDDGGKSVKESDCPPYEDGVTHIERRFSQEHGFVRAGVYAVKITMRRSNHLIAKQTANVTVRPGLGDPSNSP
jgi:hypothetical protein